jgi:hypothetical protein
VTRKMIGGVLSVLLLLQLGSAGVRLSSTPVEVPLKTEVELPFDLEPLDSHDVASVPSAGGCFQAFICTTTCPFCSKLATALADSVAGLPGSVRPIWLLPGDVPDVARWTEEHGLPSSTVFALHPKRATWWSRPVAGRVWMTPTRVVLGSSWRVKDAQPADQLLGESDLDVVCEGGGVAPGSLEAFLEMVGEGVISAEPADSVS